MFVKNFKQAFLAVLGIISPIALLVLLVSTLAQLPTTVQAPASGTKAAVTTVGPWRFGPMIHNQIAITATETIEELSAKTCQFFENRNFVLPDKKALEVYGPNRVILLPDGKCEVPEGRLFLEISDVSINGKYLFRVTNAKTGEIVLLDKKGDATIECGNNLKGQKICVRGLAGGTNDPNRGGTVDNLITWDSPLKEFQLTTRPYLHR